MKPLRRLLDFVRPAFETGGMLSKLHPLYEALDTVLYSPGAVTSGSVHVRDSMDLKRMMTVVVVALVPCTLAAMLNTGYQANVALQNAGESVISGWRGLMMLRMAGDCDPTSWWSNLVHGALYLVPVYVVTMVVGGAWEVLFACVRKHEVNEGFLVTGLLFPLILPPAIPLWQVALGISFGVVVGKEVFGGTGRNVMNPALVARAFLFFAYPAAISGDAVWTAVDGFSGATPLGAIATASVESGLGAIDVSWWQAFFGSIPGSMGETSTLACLLGAAVLIVTGVASWRIMTGIVVGALGLSSLFWLIGSDSNAVFQLAPWWHLVLGGFAFGTVFMATDPVSAAMTDAGRWIYGLLIGVMTILIRTVNPAYPEGVMLAILFGNVMAPLIDWGVVQANIRRRMSRDVA